MPQLVNRKVLSALKETLSLGLVPTTPEAIPLADFVQPIVNVIPDPTAGLAQTTLGAAKDPGTYLLFTVPLKRRWKGLLFIKSATDDNTSNILMTIGGVTTNLINGQPAGATVTNVQFLQLEAGDSLSVQYTAMESADPTYAFYYLEEVTGE